MTSLERRSQLFFPFSYLSYWYVTQHGRVFHLVAYTTGAGLMKVENRTEDGGNLDQLSQDPTGQQLESCGLLPAAGDR